MDKQVAAHQLSAVKWQLTLRWLSGCEIDMLTKKIAGNRILAIAAIRETATGVTKWIEAWLIMIICLLVSCLWGFSVAMQASAAFADLPSCLEERRRRLLISATEKVVRFDGQGWGAVSRARLEKLPSRQSCAWSPSLIVSSCTRLCAWRYSGEVFLVIVKWQHLTPFSAIH